MTNKTTSVSARVGHMRIAVDIGGTFTDMAAFDESNGALSFGKALSTKAFATSTRSAASTGPTPTTCSSPCTSR